MSILFESYALDSAHGSARLPFGARGTSLFGTLGFTNLPLGTSGSAGETTSPTAQAKATFSLATFGSDTIGAAGRVMLPLTVHGFSTLVTTPDLAVASIGIPWGTLGHAFTVSPPAQGVATLDLRALGSDAMVFGHATLALGTIGKEDGTNRTATLYQFPWIEADGYSGITQPIADTFSMALSIDADAILALLDLIQFNDTYSQAAQALQALTDGMSLADVARMIIQSDLLDSFIASGVLVGAAQLTVLLADGFALDEAAGSLATVLAAIRDGFYATITLNTGDDIYTAWVMTTQTKAMRSYSNFPFNSFATLGGQFIGAAKDGIFRMGGTQDAGESIRWAIRTGKLDFGSLQMKGAPLVYIGATTSGDLLLKVQATTVRGQMAEQTYRMTPAVTGEPREHRQQVGRGFRSVYWTFELCNDTDGATAEVHEWHAVPVKHTGKLI